MGVFIYFFVTKLETKKITKESTYGENSIFSFSSWYIIYINILHTPCKILLIVSMYYMCPGVRLKQ